MPFDSLVLRAITAEIEAALAGDRLQTVRQPDPLTVMLEFSHKRRLLISADSRAPRTYLTSHDSPRTPVPPAFCMLLRKHLEGSRLIGVRQIRFDRVLELEFRRGDGAAVLTAELMGRHSNLVLRDPEGTILGPIKPISRSVNRFRELLTGRTYQLPPDGRRLDPIAASVEECLERMGLTAGQLLDRALGEAFFGISPLLARWIGRAAGFAPGAAWSAAGSESGALAEALRGLQDRVRAGLFRPVSWADGAGREEFWAMDPPVEFSVQLEPSTSRAAESVLESRLASDAEESLRKTVVDAVRSLRRRADRRLADYQAVEERAAEAPEMRRRAQSLMAFGAEVPANAREVELPAVEGEGSIVVPLDPERSAIENAEHYFDQARSRERAAARVVDLKRAVEQEIGTLGALEAEEVSAAGPEVLRRIAGQVAGGPTSGGAGKVGLEGTKQTARSLPSGIRRLEAGGYEILYGRSSSDNDYLTTKVARPNDVWLHARGETSAHVVIRTANHPERVPRPVLLEAARVAALHSASKHSSHVAVDFTLRKYVVKRRGSPPGTVEYRGEKTVYVEPAAREAGPTEEKR